MAKNLEGMMQEALDAAADEAVSEFEAQESEDDEVVEDDAAADEGDEDALEAADEQSDGDESETDDEEPADSDVAESAEFEWDGNPQTVPENLKPYYEKVYDTMRKGVDVWMSKKAQEWNSQRQQYEARLHELETSALEGKRAALEPKLPPVPGPDASQEQIDAYYDARSKLAAFQQFKELQEAGLLPKQAAQQVPVVPDQAAVDRRVQLIQSQPGFSEEIAVAMVEVSKQNPYWAEQLQRDEGALALFQLVKTQAEAAQLKQAAAKANTAELQRKASAATRKVSKPKAAPTKVSAARNWAEMSLDDVVDAAFAEAIQESGKR